MRNVILFVCYFFFLLGLFSCKSINTRKDVEERDYDTLMIANQILSESDDKNELLSSYYIDFDIVISNYYIVTDSIAIDLNDDNLIDTIVLLTPVVLEDERFKDYLKEESPKRLLVEILNTPNGSKIRNIYDNLASSIGGVLSKYAGIYKTNQGFEIRFQSGSRYSWSYIVEFSTHHPDSIFIVRQEKICSFDGRDMRYEQFFKKASVSIISISDSIDNNCNCDPIWEKLEQISQE